MWMVGGASFCLCLHNRVHVGVNEQRKSPLEDNLRALKSQQSNAAALQRNVKRWTT